MCLRGGKLDRKNLDPTNRRPMAYLKNEGGYVKMIRGEYLRTAAIPTKSKSRDPLFTRVRYHLHRSRVYRIIARGWDAFKPLSNPPQNLIVTFLWCLSAALVLSFQRERNTAPVPHRLRSERGGWRFLYRPRGREGKPFLERVAVRRTNAGREGVCDLHLAVRIRGTLLPPGDVQPGDISGGTPPR